MPEVILGSQLTLRDCGLSVGASRVVIGMPARNWSKDVTEHSNALDLEQHVFAKNDPKAIARSLKKSADSSSRRKSSPFRSAMSMLTFYINRAGKDLQPKQRRVLENAKNELRTLYGRPTKS